MLARWTPQLTPVPSDAASMPPPFDPAASRAFVRHRAALAGVAESRSMDLALAASEILANAHDHGAGPTALRTWADGGYLICQIDDAGAGLADPFAGYRPTRNRAAYGPRVVARSAGRRPHADRPRTPGDLGALPGADRHRASLTPDRSRNSPATPEVR